MNDLTPRQKFMHRLGEYYLIPHELLHVLAYRLIKKPCRYEWGWPYVIPLAAMTRRERLFTALSSFVICFGVGLLLSLAGVTLAFLARQNPEQNGLFLGAVVIFLLSMGLVFYSSTAQGDLVNSYHLLFPKDKVQRKFMVSRVC